MSPLMTHVAPAGIENPALSPCKDADMKLDANIKGETWDPVYTCFRKVYVTLCHHRTFNQECLDNGIFPVEVIATCATVAADDKLREEYVRLLTKASMEITAANIYHLQKKEMRLKGDHPQTQKWRSVSGGLSETRSHAQDWRPGSTPIVTCHTQTQ